MCVYTLIVRWWRPHFKKIYACIEIERLWNNNDNNNDQWSLLMIMINKLTSTNIIFCGQQHHIMKRQWPRHLGLLPLLVRLYVSVNDILSHKSDAAGECNTVLSCSQATTSYNWQHLLYMSLVILSVNWVICF